MRLYDYQKAAVNNIRAVLSWGRRPLVYAPTGAGKTVIAAEVLAAHRGQRVFVVHTRQLETQARERLRPFGVDVVTIQSLLLQPDLYRDASIVCWDECHHLQGQAWREAVALFRPDTAMFGLSATPYAGELEALFDERLTAARVEQLVRLGYITPVIIRRPSELFVAGMAADERIDGALAYAGQYRGAQAIHFEPQIAQCERALAQYEALGIRAAVVTGKTSASRREAAINAFRDRRIQVLVSPVLLSEGFDAPCAQVLVAGRAFRSDVLMQQAVGRVRRAYPGKTEAYVLDCTGCCADRSPAYFNSTDDALFGSLPEHGTPEAAARETIARPRRYNDEYRWIDVPDDQWLTEGTELASQLQRAEWADVEAVLRREAAGEEARKAKDRVRNAVRLGDPEYKEKERIREAARLADPEVRAKSNATRRARLAARLADPEVRAKRNAAKRAARRASSEYKEKERIRAAVRRAAKRAEREAASGADPTANPRPTR